MYRFQQRLKNFKLHFKNWNKNVFGNIFQEKITLETMPGRNPTRNYFVGPHGRAKSGGRNT
jgi:hypothetical protein